MHVFVFIYIFYVAVTFRAFSMVLIILCLFGASPYRHMAIFAMNFTIVPGVIVWILHFEEAREREWVADWVNESIFDVLKASNQQKFYFIRWNSVIERYKCNAHQVYFEYKHKSSAFKFFNKHLSYQIKMQLLGERSRAMA